MAENWVWIGILALVAWWITSRFRERKLLAPIDPVAQGAPLIPSDDERSVRDALDARDAVADQFFTDSQARAEAEKSVAEKLNRARQIVEETGLDEAVPRLWTRVQHWRSYDGSLVADDILPEFEQVGVGGNRDEPWVGWTWRGQGYKICCRDPYGNPEIGLSVNGAAVLAVSCSVSGDPLQYRFSSLSAFVVGPWMAEVVWMDGTLERSASQFMHEMMAEFDREAARRIDLGESAAKSNQD